MLIIAGISFAQEFPDLEKEINELQGKIKSTNEKIQNVKKKIGDDEKSFSGYQKQNSDYSGHQNEELENLKRDYTRLQNETDSLSGIILKVKNNQHELDLLQERYTRLLINACEELKRILSGLPPANIQNQVSACEFLLSELSIKAVDNAEALERFWQILGALSENALSIDIFSGQSPVPFMPGQVDFIRIGHAYLAAVNEHGTSGAIWVGAKESTTAGWSKVIKPEQVLALKKCISIRQGNTVPEIIGIPFEHVIVEDTPVDQKGGSR